MDTALPPEGLVDAKAFYKFMGISRSNFLAQVRRGKIAAPVKFGESARWDVNYIRGFVEQVAKHQLEQISQPSHPIPADFLYLPVR